MRRTIERALWGAFALATGFLLVGRGVIGCGNLDEYFRGTDDSGVDTGIDSGVANTGRLSRHSRGSAIDITEDDSRVVVVNRDSGTVTVFGVTYAPEGPKLGEGKEIPRVCGDDAGGDGGEPWQVVIHPNGDAAYVVCRSAQVVVELVGIKSDAPRRSGRRVSVGSEPTGIALTPRGTSAWVANWVDGTLQRIDTAEMKVVGGSTIDLNKTLVADGYLGSIVPRPALAHPRSVAISNNGDDNESDETMVVTEYFSQMNPKPEGMVNADTERAGVVYKITFDADPPKVMTIPLRPSPDLGGIKDLDGNPAGCFPNQLQSVTINGSREREFFFAYVTSICASPRGPINVFSPTPPVPCATAADPACKENGVCDVDAGTCKPNTTSITTTVTPSITVVDLVRNETVKNGTIALNKEMLNVYQPKGIAASSEGRLPLLANDLAFLPGTYSAVFSAGGADAVFRLTFEPVYADNPLRPIGPAPFIDIGTAVQQSNLGPVGPVGIAVAHAHSNAFVANDGARTVAVIDLNASATTAGALGDSQPTTLFPTGTAGKAARGKRLFNFGLSRWSMNGQAWGACAECHIDGLTDNVTWSFPRGPRQSISLDTFFEKGPDGKATGPQRNFGWNASNDEASDLEVGVIRNMFGGIGLIVNDVGLSEASRNPLNGNTGLDGSSFDASKLSAVKDDWEDMIEYLKTIRSPRRPTNLDNGRIERGHGVFERIGCQGCHGGSAWTVSRRFYDPSKLDTNTLKSQPWPSLAGFPSTLLPTADNTLFTMRWFGDAAIANKFDSLTCALRDVGTYNVAEPGVPVSEKRQDGTEAPGKPGDVLVGYNVPSLLGLTVGAPYLHAGNARTLEALLAMTPETEKDKTFEKHRDAFRGAAALSADDLRDLLEFLLAIDHEHANEMVVSVPPLGARGGVICALP